MKQFIAEFMERLDFPEEAREEFLRIHDLWEQNPRQYASVEELTERFSSDPKAVSYDEVAKALEVLLPDETVHSYSAQLLFFIYCAKPLREKYKKENLPEDLYWASMMDLKYKLMECRNIHGVWGTFVGSWFPRFFVPERFALGRFQYEHAEFNQAGYEKAGVSLRKGDPVYNIHIPSAGPLTWEARMDSYQKAYAFYQERDHLGGKPMAIVCHSWLLYPKNRVFFPKTSNILGFMDDFDIISGEDQEEFCDMWRVFGSKGKEPLDRLPTDTSLQRAFVDWLKAGGKTGFGYGVLIFDGEKIL